MRDLFVCCPFHDGDRTPSLSILLEDKNGLKAGFSHCFGCGWSGSYKQVEKAMGKALDIEPKIRELLDNKNISCIRSSSQLKLRVGTDIQAKQYKKHELPFKYSQYLSDRGIGERVQRLNKVYQNSILNMPFFDPDGNMMGCIQRGVDGAKFYKVEGSIRYPIGIEEIRPKDFVYVTEGQIDKMTLEEAGFKAVALGTVSNYKLIRYLKNFNICLAFDNDLAGKKATEMAYQFIRQTRTPYMYTLDLPDKVKDINEFLVDVKNSGDSVKVISDWVKYNTRRI